MKKALIITIAVLLIVGLVIGTVLIIKNARDNKTTTTTKVPAVQMFDFLSINIREHIYISPEDYSSFVIDVDESMFTVTDDDVDDYIKLQQSKYLDNCPTYAPNYARRSVSRDYINFYFTVYVDGVTYETNMDQPKPTRWRIGMGEYMSIIGFDAGLTGLSAADTSLQKRTEGVVDGDDIVYLSYTYTYDEYGREPVYEERYDRIDMANIPEWYGPDFRDRLLGAEIGEQLSFTTQADFNGDGNDDTKTYVGYVALATEEQTRTVSARFPHYFSATPELADKDATIEIIMVSVEDEVYPEVTEAFIKNTLGFEPETDDVIAEYRQSVKDGLQELAEQDKRYYVDGRIMDMLTERATLIKLPDGAFDFYYIDIYNRYAAQFEREYEYNMLFYGESEYTTVGEYIEVMEELEPGVDGIEWLEQSITDQLKGTLAVYYIANDLGLTYTDDVLLEYCEVMADQIAAEQGVRYTPEFILQELGRDYVTDEYFHGAVSNYCYEHTTIN